MKNLRFALVALMIVSGGAFAEEDHTGHNQKSKKGVEEIVKEGKSSRRKKVEMCHDCGKPEVNCDCPEEVRAKEAAAKKAGQ